LIVVFVIPFSRKPEPAIADLDMINGLTFANGILFVVEFLLAFLLPGRILSRNNFQRVCASGKPGDAAMKAISLYRISSIISMALLEWVVLFAIVICLIALINGVTDKNPVYWLNAFPVIIYIVYGMATFPTRSRILDTLERKLLEN
jgi:hypothetical protein